MVMAVVVEIVVSQVSVGKFELWSYDVAMVVKMLYRWC